LQDIKKYHREPELNIEPAKQFIQKHQKEALVLNSAAGENETP